MNLDCYYCADTGLLSSDEPCGCVTRSCKCHNCLYRNAEHAKMINEQVKKIDKQFAKQKEVNKKPPYKQWEQPELPFNKHKKVPTGYDPKSYNKDYPKKNPVKPDPATVEAELQLEEQLWQS